MTIGYVPSGSHDQTLNHGLEALDALGEEFNWCPVAPAFREVLLWAILPPDAVSLWSRICPLSMGLVSISV
jgi:hypothetical protein